MKLFDAHIYSDTRSDSDLANMAFFGVSDVLTCAHHPRPFQTALELGHHFEQLIVTEAERLRRHGITPHVAIGVHPKAQPIRAHHELWRDLPQIWREPEVVAVGELGVLEGTAQEWGLVERQIRLLAQSGLDLPIIFAMPRRDDARWRRGCIERLTAILEAHGLGPGRVVLQHIDWLTIDAALEAGYWCGVSIHPFFQSLEQAVTLAQHHNRRRLIANSALRDGPADILALPKVTVALAEAGIEAADIQRICLGAAKEVFGG